MKQSIHILMFTACLLTLSACGAYVGSPPKSEVHESVTTTPRPNEVHVYHAP